MRKALSLVLVAAMLVGGMIFAPATVSAATLDEYNVAAEARYFGGSVSVWEGHGSYTGNLSFKDDPRDKYDVKTGNPDNGSVLLDGILEDGEWGDPMVVVDSKYAPNNGGLAYGANTAFETPSAENTYYYYKMENGNTGLKYTVYMMWDEGYLYVAADVYDADGHQNGNGGGEVWDSDAFQIRVDTKGPNSVCEGKGYDAIGNTASSEVSTYVTPWADEEKNDRGAVIHERVSNLLFAYTSSSSGTTEKWDSALRYNPTEKTYTDINGNETTLTVYNSDDASNYMLSVFGKEGVHGMVRPKNEGTKRNPKWHTVYELAIPWGIIDEEYAPTAGDELGVSTVLLNAASGQLNYNSWLAWGSGICKSQLAFDPQTAGGSNCVTLSDVSYKEARCTHEEFDAATCIAPETCKNCGYQRGYKTGHHYVFSDDVIPTATDAGSIKAKCTVCGDSYIQPIAAGGETLRYSFHTDDTTIADKGLNSGFTAVWRSSNETNDDNERIGPMIYNEDGSVKNSYAKKAIGSDTPIAVADLYTNGSDITAITGDVSNADQTGTYFDFENVPTTYSYKMDVYFPDLNDLIDHKYNAGVRNWVGDATGYGFYGVGLYRVEGKYYFAIISNRDGEGTGMTTEGFKAAALDWVEVSEDELLGNKWHTYAMMFDEESGTAMFAWDGELKVAATDYHMKYNKSDNQSTPFFRRFNLGLYIKDVELGDSGLFCKYATAPEVVEHKYTATINGVSAQYTEGAVVNVEKAFYTEGGRAYRFTGWTGDVNVLADATSGNTSFVMPDRDITITASYYMVGDIDNNGFANAQDSAALKDILLGMAETDEIPTADINGDGAVNTKDSYLFKLMMSGKYVPEK